MAQAPFVIPAHAVYVLEAGALTISLTVVNRAAKPLPFGLGFHPGIVRTRETFLQAEAERVVFETNDHLPCEEAQASSRSEWSFASQRRLLEAWIKTLSSDGPVARTLFGLIANWRSISKPIHRSRLTSSMLPQRVPISSVSSR
jgi:galactose mutarotase-like enzyme